MRFYMDWLASASNEEIRESMVCRMCGRESFECLEHIDIHDQAQVCGMCASIVANTFAKKLSGKYLTWEEHETENLPTPTYRPRKKISSSIRTLVFERDAYRCVKCGSFKQLCIDHVYPHSLGGSDDPENLQTLCWDCNSRKGNKVEVING